MLVKSDFDEARLGGLKLTARAEINIFWNATSLDS